MWTIMRCCQEYSHNLLQLNVGLDNTLEDAANAPRD
jgi:hypothetical protein